MPKTRSGDDDEAFKATEDATAEAIDAASITGGNTSNTNTSREATKILPAVPIPEPEPDPNVPCDRDVIVANESHYGTMLLYDLIRMHFYIYKKQQEGSMAAGQDFLPKREKDVEGLAARLTSLMMNGRKYELSGLKDVPKPYLKGTGRFFEQVNRVWTRLEEADAKKYVAQTILSQFKKFSNEAQNAEIKESVDTLFANMESKAAAGEDNEPNSAPRPCDVLFLPTEYPWEENMAYEHQSGNKHLLMIAALGVTGDTTDSDQRAEAALRLISSKVEVSNGTEITSKDPRFVIQQSQDESQNTWDEMGLEDLVEFSAVFVFEIYLEKQIHRLGTIASVSIQMASLSAETTKPSDTPIDTPTTHDVLFGRGGMTNGHSGNRRFRDIITLHRPDYIKATKMDKPNVARRIVRSIRQGNPAGRFLKKSEDGLWRDVGDKVAAEKTSQGLRERSNAEKRHRSALREALRIRKEDMAEGEDGEPASKKAKSTGNLNLSIDDLDYSGVIPLSLNMKEKGKAKKGKKGKDDETAAQASLPPNAVDEEGSILVTDYGKSEMVGWSIGRNPQCSPERFD